MALSKMGIHPNGIKMGKKLSGFEHETPHLYVSVSSFNFFKLMIRYASMPNIDTHPQIARENIPLSISSWVPCIAIDVRPK